MADIIARRYQLVECPVQGVAGGNTSTKFIFQDQPFLRHATIQAIEMYTNGDCNVSPVSQFGIVTDAVNLHSFLTLVQSGTEMIQKIPVNRLHDMVSGAPYQRYMFLLDDLTVDWSKCYIETVTAPANTTNLTYLFGVYYTPGAGSNQ